MVNFPKIWRLFAKTSGHTALQLDVEDDLEVVAVADAAGAFDGAVGAVEAVKVRPAKRIGRGVTRLGDFAPFGSLSLVKYSLFNASYTIAAVYMVFHKLWTTSHKFGRNSLVTLTSN